MDLDEAQVENEVNLTPNGSTQQAVASRFSPFPFTHERRNAILTRRSAMFQELVFDILLEQASIASPQSLYPPDSPESLLELLDAIAHCPWDILKKSCLEYYLLSHVSMEVASQHAVDCALPPQFVHLAQACFLLDCGSLEDLSRAVALLADARIVQDLSSKVLQTLALAPKSNSSFLVRSYIRTSQPVLEEYEDLAIYLRALIEYNLADAWSFQRTFSETAPIRNQLIRTALDTCLIPPKPALLKHMLSLPLTSYEFSLLQSYALAPPENLPVEANAILQNLITVRLLHSGKYSDVIRISRTFDALNAKSHPNSTSPLHKAAEERQKMMGDVLAVIPEVQRRQLELELSDEQVSLSASSSWMNVGSDVSMSWENLEASTGSKVHSKIVDGARSGRLEGSPVPTFPRRPITPFGATSSAQKRKLGARAKDLGTATPTRAPAFPQIPIAPVEILPSQGISSPFGGLATPRLSFPLRSLVPQEPQANTRTLDSRLNARNVLPEKEQSPAGPSLLPRQRLASAPFSILARGKAGSDVPTPVRSTSPAGERSLGGQDNATKDAEDIVMVDSDDPDAFVVHGKRPSMYRSTRGGSPNDAAGPNPNEADATSPLFAPSASAARKMDESRQESVDRVLPGGFTSMELIGDTQPPPSSSYTKTSAESRPRNERQSSRTRSRAATSEKQPPLSSEAPSRLKIPGALFDEDGEAQEDEDVVPPLRSPAARSGRRKRASSSGTDAQEDDYRPRTPPRRSSRLSSIGLSPEAPEKKATNKRPSKASANGKTGRKKKKMDR